MTELVVLLKVMIALHCIEGFGPTFKVMIYIPPSEELRQEANRIDRCEEHFRKLKNIINGHEVKKG